LEVLELVEAVGLRYLDAFEDWGDEFFDEGDFLEFILVELQKTG